MTPDANQASIESSFTPLLIDATGVAGSGAERPRFYCFLEQCDRAVEIDAAVDRGKLNVVKLKIRHP